MTESEKQGKSRKNNVRSKSKKDNECVKDFSSDALFFSFNNVKYLNLSFETANVVVIPGKSFCIETRGLPKENLIFEHSGECLSVTNNKHLNFNFLNHSHNYHIVPRILVTIPQNAKFERLKISMKFGKMIFKNISLSCTKAQIYLNGGILLVEKLSCLTADVRCFFGKLNLCTIIRQRANVDCVAGSIFLNLEESVSDFSYDLKLAMGDCNFDDDCNSGFKKKLAENVKSTHFSVNCVSGNVSFKMHDYGKGSIR